MVSEKNQIEKQMSYDLSYKRNFLTFLHISKINGSLWSITEMKWFFYNKFESYMKI